MPTRTVVLIAACAALAGCGGGGNEPSVRPTTTPTDARPAGATRAIKGGVTTLRIDPAASKILDYAGVQLTGVNGAGGTGGVVRFPVTGGKLSLPPLQGRITHAGALRISVNGQHVDATDLRFEPAREVLTGVIRGKRVPLLRVKIAAPTTFTPGRAVQLSGKASVIGSRIVKAFGRSQHVDVLRSGLPVGQLQISAR